jgi:hypothetical protein
MLLLPPDGEGTAAAVDAVDDHQRLATPALHDDGLCCLTAVSAKPACRRRAALS